MAEKHIGRIIESAVFDGLLLLKWRIDGGNIVRSSFGISAVPSLCNAARIPRGTEIGDSNQLHWRDMVVCIEDGKIISWSAIEVKS